ncbi:MAG: hypothetical protein ABSG43_09460, partial [Solirubrobacteraceae bacterium]
MTPGQLELVVGGAITSWRGTPQVVVAGGVRAVVRATWKVMVQEVKLRTHRLSRSGPWARG